MKFSSSVLVGSSAHGTGGHSFANNLRKALQPHGACVFRVATERLPSDRTADLTIQGHDLKLSYGQAREGAKALLSFLEDQPIDVLLPANNPLLTSTIPHLPFRTIALPRCNAIVNSAYYQATRHRAHAPLILVVSPRQRYDLVMKWGVSPRRIRLVPHGTEVPPTMPDTDLDLNKVVFIGRLERPKGAHLLPDVVAIAATSNPQFRLEIIGDGSYRAQLEAELDHRKLAKFVTFRGKLDRDDVMATLAHAPILVNPTQHDGFGLVTIEAMAHGAVPVVSRIRGVTTAIIENRTSGLLCSPKSAVSFGKAVAKLQSNRARLAFMRCKAHVRARTEFSLEVMASRYLAVIQELKHNPHLHRASPYPLTHFAEHERYTPSFFAKAIHKVT